MRIAVDTNIVIRFLTHDDEAQYQRAYRLFQRPHIFVPTTVFLETEWVLRFAYKYGATEIVRAFRMLLGLANVEAEEPSRIAKALTWHQTGLDFADALHLASSQQCDILYTFDREFAKKGKSVSACEVKELKK
jgi:predicted nucleic-acid-binding protein